MPSRALRTLVQGLPRTYWYLWTAMLINRLGGFLFTFLAIYLTQTRGFSIAVASILVALYGAGSLAAGPLGGVLADRVGRRPTMLLGAALSAAAMLTLGMARELRFLAVVTAVLGLLSDLGRPARMAAVADLVAPADRTRAYGLLYWASNLGFAGASVLAGLVAKLDPRLLFLGDAATTLLFGAVIYLLVPETLPARQDCPHAPPLDLAQPYRDGVFVAFVFTQMLVGFIFFQDSSTLPLDMTAHGLTMAEYGRLNAINGVLIVLLQPLATRTLMRIRRSRVLAVGALLTGVGFYLPAQLPTIGGYALGISVWTIGEILMSPVASAVVADLAPAELRGSYQGAFHLCWGMGALLGPAVGGYILQNHGGVRLWEFCLLLGLLGALLHLTLGPARRLRLQLALDGPAAVRREDGHPGG
jgi:MFS family permease